MIIYRVDDLDSLLDSLRIAGIEVIGEVSVEDFGKFVHIRDLHGRRIQLREPIDSEYEKIRSGLTDKFFVINLPASRSSGEFGRELEYFSTRGII